MAEWLAAGTSAATSTNITLADGEECTVALFVTGTGPASIPGLAYVLIVVDQGDGNADTVGAFLGGTNPVAVIRGPGDYYCYRPDLSAQGVTTPVGVNSSTTPA